MLPPKKGSAKVQFLRWWRNWVAALTTSCVLILVIVLVVGAPGWMIALVALGTIYGLFHVASLTRQVNALDAESLPGSDSFHSG